MQPTNATEIVLEGGRMRIGPTKVIKTDLKIFKVNLLTLFDSFNNLLDSRFWMRRIL